MPRKPESPAAALGRLRWTQTGDDPREVGRLGGKPLAVPLQPHPQPIRELVIGGRRATLWGWSDGEYRAYRVAFDGARPDTREPERSQKAAIAAARQAKKS